MKDLILSINRNNTNKGILNSPTKKEKKCNFCGITIEKYSHFHLKDGINYSSCSLCYYVEHLDELKTLKNGSIIMMPELTQVELFSILRMIWFIEQLELDSKDDRYEEIFDSTRNIHGLIKERIEFSSHYYTGSIENVNTLINFLHSLDDNKYEKRHIGLKNLLWLPDKSYFLSEIKYWVDVEYHTYHPKNFKKIINEIIKYKKGKK
jgi:hypothetical protein